MTLLFFPLLTEWQCRSYDHGDGGGGRTIIQTVMMSFFLITFSHNLFLAVISCLFFASWSTCKKQTRTESLCQKQRMSSYRRGRRFSTARRFHRSSTRWVKQTFRYCALYKVTSPYSFPSTRGDGIQGLCCVGYTRKREEFLVAIPNHTGMCTLQSGI